jgi:hypothetical protein
MNRLLTLASTGLFAAGLAIAPIGAFAQQNSADTKTDAPVSHPVTAADAKAPAAVTKAEPTTKQTMVTKDARHGMAPAAGTPKAATPSSNTSATQPKTVDHGKS